MADSDQPDPGNPPTDGVDDETFARAVGLDQQEIGRRSPRKRRMPGTKSSRTAKEERRTKDKQVVRRPPAGQKGREQIGIPEPNDETGVVPVIDKEQPLVVDTQISQQNEPVLPKTPAEEQRVSYKHLTLPTICKV